MNDEEEHNLFNDKGLKARSNEEKIAGKLRGLESTLKELTKASKSQTEMLNGIKEDLLIIPDPTDQGEQCGNEVENDPNVRSIVANLLDSSNDAGTEALQSSHDTEVEDDVIDSLTQAYLPHSRQSPPVEAKIASFLEQSLTGELCSDMLTETGEKYPPPDNCKNLTTVMVNEEIWDLLTRKSRTVDFGFQKVQGPLMQGLSALSIRADRLLKDVKNVKDTNIRDVLQQLRTGERCRKKCLQQRL